MAARQGGAGGPGPRPRCAPSIPSVGAPLRTSRASAPSETVAGLAVTDRELPVSGSVAVADGTVRVCPAAAWTVYGLDWEMVITGLSPPGPMRMRCEPRSSA